MNKKYLLKIDYSKITKDNFEIAQLIKERGMDNEVIQETETENQYHVVSTCNSGFYCENIPKSWLTEITEPQEFDKWFEQQDLPLFESTKTQHERTWKSGIENDHLKIMQRLESAKLEFIKDIDEELLSVEAFDGFTENCFEIIKEILNDNT